MLGFLIVVCFSLTTQVCAMNVCASVTGHASYGFCGEAILTVIERQIWSRIFVPFDFDCEASHSLPGCRDDSGDRCRGSLLTVSICVLRDLRRCLRAVSCDVADHCCCLCACLTANLLDRPLAFFFDPCCVRLRLGRDRRVAVSAG